MIKSVSLVSCIIASSVAFSCVPADASLFSKIGHAVSKTVKVVERKTVNSVKTVERVAGKDTKAVGHAIGGAASGVGKGAAAGVKFVAKNEGTAIRVSAAVASKGLSLGASAMREVPVLKSAAPLVTDMSKAMKTKLFQRAALVGLNVGAGAVINGGGTAALSTVPNAAVGYGMTAHYGQQAGKWAASNGKGLAADVKSSLKAQ